MSYLLKARSGKQKSKGHSRLLAMLSQDHFCLHLWCVYVKSLQLCPTLCDPMDGSPPGSSVHGILQARILEWIALPSLQGIFLTQGLNPHFLRLLLWQVGSLPLALPGKPTSVVVFHLKKKSNPQYSQPGYRLIPEASKSPRLISIAITGRWIPEKTVPWTSQMSHHLQQTVEDLTVHMNYYKFEKNILVTR